jgi:hypothetical protein
MSIDNPAERLPALLKRASNGATRKIHSKKNIVLAGLIGGPVVGALGTVLLFVGSFVWAGSISMGFIFGLVLMLVVNVVGGVVAGLLISSNALLFCVGSARLGGRADLGLGVGAFLAGTVLAGAEIFSFGLDIRFEIGLSVLFGSVAAAGLVLEWNRGWCVGFLRE